MLKKFVNTTCLLLSINCLVVETVDAKRYNLTVIQDEEASSIPVDRYMNDHDGAAAMMSPAPTRVDTFNPFDFGFPIRSKKWKVGAFERKVIEENDLPTSFFVVGCNQESRDWLDDRKADLLSLSVLGFVIQCESRQSLDELKAYAEPLRLFHMDADIVGARLDHYTYPALITRQTIEQ